jgi:hypothetical protein
MKQAASLLGEGSQCVSGLQLPNTLVETIPRYKDLQQKLMGLCFLRCYVFSSDGSG